MRLQFTRSATRDLTRQRDLIAHHDFGAAARAGGRVTRAICLLHGQTELGQAVEDLPDVRELVAAGDYVVRCTVRDGCVVVPRIWHGREDR